MNVIKKEIKKEKRLVIRVKLSKNNNIKNRHFRNRAHTS